MNTPKNRNSSRGAQLECINFEMCPLCYGCRNCNPDLTCCQECLKDPKLNICNVKSHKTHLISRMVKKQTIDLSKYDL